jgi:CHASE3 domain sensor protein
MNRALRFRRKLAWTWIAVAVVLLVTFYVAVRGAREAIELEGWVAHTQEVLGVISEARLERVRLVNQLLTRQLVGGDATQLDADSTKLTGDIARLRKLTADNPAQQNLLAEIEEVLNQDLTKLAVPAKTVRAEGSGRIANSLAWAGVAETTARFRALFDHLEANERTLLAARSGAVQANARATRLVVYFAAAFTFFVLGLAGYFIQREIINRGRIETGLRKAQDLLGLKFEDQKTELEHVICAGRKPFSSPKIMNPSARWRAELW